VGFFSGDVFQEDFFRGGGGFPGRIVSEEFFQGEFYFYWGLCYSGGGFFSGGTF
jgi:hypothetical protein